MQTFYLGVRLSDSDIDLPQQNLLLVMLLYMSLHRTSKENTVYHFLHVIAQRYRVQLHLYSVKVKSTDSKWAFVLFSVL